MSYIVFVFDSYLEVEGDIRDFLWDTPPSYLDHVLRLLDWYHCSRRSLPRAVRVTEWERPT